MNILEQAFYMRDSIIVAKELLGKILVREIEGKHYEFRIVETEAYMGVEDKAAHSYGGRRTNRTEPMFREGGITYIYFIYGMYYCLNIVVNSIDVPQAVLIRALEPISEKDVEFARSNRMIKSNKIVNLTNGPGKLCSALIIDKSLNKMPVTKKNNLWIKDAPLPTEIISDKRINIPYAEEYQDKEWRFYIKNNSYVSILKNS